MRTIVYVFCFPVIMVTADTALSWSLSQYIIACVLLLCLIFTVDVWWTTYKEDDR